MGEGILSPDPYFCPYYAAKPSKRSKARDHTKYLAARLEKWAKGDLNKLISECKEIQKRLMKSQIKKVDSKRKAFCRLMLLGKVKQACKFINNDDAITGVHRITDNIKEALLDKHPKGEDAHPEVLLPLIRPAPNPVIFEQITAETIQRSSKNLNGSGGPTLVDADAWKHFICSRSYGNHSSNLAYAIAGLAKRLCREEILSLDTSRQRTG